MKVVAEGLSRDLNAPQPSAGIMQWGRELSPTSCNTNIIYEMKKYLYDIYFDFRSVTRFAKIWLETTAYFILTASQVDVIVVKHS